MPAVRVMQVRRIPADASPIGWLFDAVKDRQSGDVLAPITVAFPSAGAALSTRRALGRKGSLTSTARSFLKLPNRSVPPGSRRAATL
jgi:hypothetical protein